MNVSVGSSLLSKLPPSFLYDIESAGDRLMVKAPQLIQNKTTNITENFMSIKKFACIWETNFILKFVQV